MVVSGRVVGGVRESDAAYTWKGEGVMGLYEIMWIKYIHVYRLMFSLSLHIRCIFVIVNFREGVVKSILFSEDIFAHGNRFPDIIKITPHCKSTDQWYIQLDT